MITDPDNGNLVVWNRQGGIGHRLWLVDDGEQSRLYWVPEPKPETESELPQNPKAELWQKDRCQFFNELWGQIAGGQQKFVTATREAAYGKVSGKVILTESEPGRQIILEFYNLSIDGLQENNVRPATPTNIQLNRHRHLRITLEKTGDEVIIETAVFIEGYISKTILFDGDAGAGLVDGLRFSPELRVQSLSKPQAGSSNSDSRRNRSPDENYQKWDPRPDKRKRKNLKRRPTGHRHRRW